jgi:phage tail-like protein
VRTAGAVRATPHLAGARIDLRWRNPPAADFAPAPDHTGGPFAAIRVVRRERTFPLGPDDGDVVYPDGPVVDRLTDDQVIPLRTYYYTVFTRDSTNGFRADEGSRASAFATADFGSAAQLYRMLPAAHQRADLPPAVDRLAALPASVREALAALPPELRARGQLYRFLSAAAAPLDLVRSFAEGLRRMRDPASIPAQYLPALASWLGWELNRALPVSAQRNEVSFAPPLYRGVGTVPNLRAIVNRYTGWHVQVAELAQSIARSNAPAQLNVFAVHERAPGVWCSTDDAAAALGLVTATGGTAATGETTAAGGTAATVTGTAAAPFALRPGMRLTVTADDRVPVTVVFGSGDFADIAEATAAEIVAVLNRTLSEVTASRVDGRVVLTSHTTGAVSSVRIEESAAGLVTLEGAPTGRLSPCAGADRRLRLFYATAALADPTRRTELRLKTFRGGRWGGAVAVPTGAAPVDPAAATLEDGSIVLVWVDPAAGLRWAVGVPRPLRPAVLPTGRTAPFVIRPGSRLVVRAGGRRHGLVFVAADLGGRDGVGAEKLADVLSTRLPGLTATARPDRTVELRSRRPGGDQRLVVEIPSSDAAGALGFDATNNASTGDWGDELDWTAPAGVLASPPPGRVAEPCAVADGPDTVRLFWSAHDGTRWTIASARWAADRWAPPEVLASSGGGNVEPAAVRVTDDSGDRLWLFWAQRAGAARADSWVLRRRVLDLATGNWGDETGLMLPSGDPVPGREPAPAVVAGTLRLYFRSRRLGASDVLAADLAADGVIVSEPAPVVAGPATDRLAAPVVAPVGNPPGTPDPLWLLFRSDRGVALSGLATREMVRPDNRAAVPRTTSILDAAAADGPADFATSLRAVDTGTQRRFAGTTTFVPRDAARNGRRGRWDDLVAYTPNRPRGGRPSDTEIYTRGTLALYLSPVVPESALSVELEQQLRPLLERFLPVSTRAVVRFAPRDTVELVYPPGADLAELLRPDVHPFLEIHPGVTDRAAAALPDWVRLRATTPGHVSADPADLPTLAFRTWFAAPS